ncbi:MAG: hypothetical protein WD042_06590 [Phycisphaeraceae bacterium]
MVVAILALLLALILPALGSARESARQALCASNLRQVGEASSSYVTDNRGWMPVVNDSAQAPNSSNAVWLKSGNTFRLYGWLYKQYLNSDGRVFYCPSATDWVANGTGGLANIGTALGDSKGSYFQRGIFQGALQSNRGLVHDTDPLYANDPGKRVRDRKVRRAMIADLIGFRKSSGPGRGPGNHGTLVAVLYSDLAVNPAIMAEGFSVMDSDGIYGGDYGGIAGAWTLFDERGSQ